MRSTTTAATTARFGLALLGGKLPLGTALAFAILLAALSGVAPLASAQTVTFADQTPGPSQALFNSSYYTCNTNYYVSPTGSDSNAGTQTDPWLTLQHANDALPSGGVAAGTCINVEPGTYASGVIITNGGNLASATGYVVYRCTTMDACKITAAGFASDAFRVESTNWSGPDYIMIDGFNIAAATSDTYGVGIAEVDPSNPGGGGIATTHHLWVLNSLIHGYGQAGIGAGGTDYQYYLHNTVYDNANNTCDAQGSGIGIVVPKNFPNYTPTADDLTNPNSLIGTFVTGSSFFHNVIEWNITYNNALTNCGTASNPYDTDGNGIILDTFNTRTDGSGNSVDYPDSSLVALNVSYNNGGRGIHIFDSEYVTVANNSVYNNEIDPYDDGAGNSGIDTQGGYDNTVINNIATAIPGEHTTCAYYVTPYSMWNTAILGSPETSTSPPDTFSHNVTYLFGGYASCYNEDQMFNGDTYSASLNKENTNPLWINVGNTSVGTETTPPVGADFTLQAGSPAIGYALSEPYLPGITDDGAYQSGAPVPAPTVSLSASPTSITSGQSSTLTWFSTNTTSCTGTGFTASDTSGSASVSPTQTTTYLITCTSADGSVEASASVAITSGAPPPTPAPPPTTVPPSKSSGGAMGGLGLLLLGALVGLSGARRRRALNDDPDIVPRRSRKLLPT